MDATLKRRVWKVIGYHFFFTVLLLSLVLSAHVPMVLNPSDSASWIILIGAPALFLLQPLSYMVAEVNELVGLLIIPIWSIGFGWAFVKLDNWLNHFPVLGKKVF